MGDRRGKGKKIRRKVGEKEKARDRQRKARDNKYIAHKEKERHESKEKK